MNPVNFNEPILGYPSMAHMLEDLYLREKLSINEIALRCGLHITTINRYMSELGIPKRKRGGGNNTARFARLLHLLDQRSVMHIKNMDLAELTGIDYNVIYKYKRGVTATWNSQSSVQQPGWNATRR